MKYFIISQPKAGTYLCANLLTEFNLINTRLHISERKYELYDFNNLEESRKSLTNFSYSIPIHDSLTKIFDNQFAVGHVPYSENNRNLLKNFKKILLIRNRAEIKDSAFRWAHSTGRSLNIKKVFDIADCVLKWKQDNVFVIDFRDLIEKNENIINELQMFLFGNILYDSAKSIKNALIKDSLTKSDLR